MNDDWLTLDYEEFSTLHALSCDAKRWVMYHCYSCGSEQADCVGHEVGFADMVWCSECKLDNPVGPVTSYCPRCEIVWEETYES